MGEVMRDKLLRYLYKKMLYKNRRSSIGDIKHAVEYNLLFQKYREFCQNNKACVYNFKFTKKASDVSRQYVGAIELSDSIYCTPNHDRSILCVASPSEKIGEFDTDDYKWTGECVYKKRLYCFPRAKSDMICLSEDGDLTYIRGKHYEREHHYGGVLYKNIVIQPPRSSSHFLVWDLDKETSYTLKICPEFLRKYCRYNCSIAHPNGYLYFFPENGRVIKFNPNNEQWEFIGDWIDTMIFDAKISLDGNIYGFSINKGGIVKLDVSDDSVTVLFPDMYLGAYGTKMGINGILYSVPGSGRYIWAFNPITLELKQEFDTEDDGYAKYAGGCTCRNGKILAAPSFANKFLVGEHDADVMIPEDLYKVFWEDCY